MNRDIFKHIIDYNDASDGHGIFRRDRYFNAAVLIPFIEKDGQWYILLQKRAQDIRQGGEISFPGGGYEEQDNSFRETALRETVEELGIAREAIEIYGKLDTYIGRSGLIIEPYIGVLNIDNIDDLEPDRTEVEDLLCVPLRFFMDNEPDIYHTEVSQSSIKTDGQGNQHILLPVRALGLPERYEGIWGRISHEIYVYTYQDDIIWGLTADMLYDVAKRVRGEYGDGK